MTLIIVITAKMRYKKYRNYRKTQKTQKIPKNRKCVEGYGFLLCAKEFGNKYGKNLIDIATKTVIDTAKTPSKRVVLKIAEATRDLIGNKRADKITSAGKTKSKDKEYKINKREEIYIPLEKRFFQIYYKNGIPKNYKPARYHI